MRALSIRQPFAELILRGIKTVEYRTRRTTIIGERFLIYATQHKGPMPTPQWPVNKADNIIVPDAPLPAWMVEIAQQLKLIDPEAVLPRGVIVGSAVIDRVSSADQMFAWHLTDIERATELRKPTGHPQPVWFEPF